MPCTSPGSCCSWCAPASPRRRLSHAPPRHDWDAMLRGRRLAELYRVLGLRGHHWPSSLEARVGLVVGWCTALRIRALSLPQSSRTLFRPLALAECTSRVWWHVSASHCALVWRTRTWYPGCRRLVVAHCASSQVNRADGTKGTRGYGEGELQSVVVC